MDDSVITCDKIIEEIFPTNLDEKKATCKTQNFYILILFLLIPIKLLTAASICCCLVKYETKTFITVSLHKYQIKNINKK